MTTEKELIYIRSDADLNDDIMQNFSYYFRDPNKSRYHICSCNSIDGYKPYVLRTKKYDMCFVDPKVFIGVLTLLNRPFIVLKCGENINEDTTNIKVIDFCFVLGLSELSGQKIKFKVD